MHIVSQLVVPITDQLDVHPHHRSPSTDLPLVLAQALIMAGTTSGQAVLV